MRRIAVMYLMEYAEDLSTSRCYLSQLTIADFMVKIRSVA